MTAAIARAQPMRAFFARFGLAQSDSVRRQTSMAIDSGNSLLPARVSESLTSIPAIMDPQKPPAGVHVVVATYLCTLQAFLRVQTQRVREGDMITDGV